MVRDLINVQYPLIEDTQSVASVEVDKTTVSDENGITVKNAFANKNNTLFVFITNNGESDAEVTFLSGNMYPNSILGNLVQTVPASSVTAFQFQDAARFENKDGSLNVDFEEGFSGDIFAIAKPTSLNV